MTDITHRDLERMEEKIVTRIDKLRDELKDELKQYVREEEFKPVRSIVYGGVGLVLTGVAIALLALVVTSVP